MNLISGTVEADGELLRAVAPGLSVRLPPFSHAAYRPYAGKPIIIGMRPEDFHETPQAAGALVSSMSATIETVEALGPETVLMLRLPENGAEIAARVSAAGNYSARHPVKLFYDAGNIHLFDPKTQKRIARPPA